MLGCVGRSVRGLMRVLMLMLAAAPCLGQGPTPPDVLPYQGTLVNGDGDPLGTPTPRNYDVVFRIFDDPSSGNLLWAEQQTVTVDAGRFSVQLGLGASHGTEPRPPIAIVFRNATASDRYLETTVKGVGPSRADSTLMPRVRILPIAYAAVVQHARTAGRLINSVNGGVISVVGPRLGINTTNPATALDIAGNAKVASLQVSGDVRSGGTARAASWVGAGAVPVGTVILWSGSAAERPVGWALCDGSLVNGYRTPDLRGRFVLGAGAGPGLAERRVGQSGGAETHRLVVDELPSHGHLMQLGSVMASMGGGHQHSLTSEANDAFPRYHWANPVSRAFGMNLDDVSYYRQSVRTSDTSQHAHFADLPATASFGSGGGQPHGNMPPFYVLAYIVRVQ